LSSRFVDNLVAVVGVVIVGGIPLVNPEMMRQPARPSVMPFWAMASVLAISILIISFVKNVRDRGERP